MKYIPILQEKRGEIRALAVLTDGQKRRIAPVIQMIDGRNTDAMIECWNFPGNLCFFDVSLMTDTRSSVQILEAFIEGGINCVPVIHQRMNPRLNAVTRDRFSDNGICLRFEGAMLRPRNVNKAIQEACDYFSLKVNEIDLLIDCGYIPPQIDSGLLVAMVSNIYESLDEIPRRIIVSSGSFPENLANIQADTTVELARTEWFLWNAIQREIGKGKIIYSDYGNHYPRPVGVPFPGTCSIKYTTEDSYFILRGRRAQDHPDAGGQYHAKSGLLIANRLYDGPDFSWGDKYIFDCAARIDGPGNAETWVKVTLNHHLVKILSLLR